METSRLHRLARRGAIVALAACLGWGCATAAPPAERYRFFGPPEPEADPWYEKIEGWQERERLDLPETTLAGSEAVREAVFKGERSPLVFGDPERWIALALESLRLSAADKLDDAERLRDEAYEDAPEASGSIDGERFEWIADADTRIGPFLDNIANRHQLGTVACLVDRGMSIADVAQPDDGNFEHNLTPL